LWVGVVEDLVNCVRKHSLLVALIVVLGALLATRAPQVRAQGPSQVGLVVVRADGSVITRCVAFDAPEITGYDVLARSGQPFVTSFGSGSGGAVCALAGDGCPASDCFCQCKGTPCRYWIYHHQVDGQWVYASLGASMHTVRHGDVEGWAWGEGSATGGAQPPVISFEQICAAGAPPEATDPPSTATPPVVATTTPSPMPTATEEPTPTSAATETPVVAPPEPTETVVPTGSPTSPPSATPSLTPSAAPQATGTMSAPAGPSPESAGPTTGDAPRQANGYLAFGGIVLALSLSLGLSAKRRA